MLNLSTISDLVFRGYAEVIEGVPGVWLTDKGRAVINSLNVVPFRRVS